MAEDGGDRDQQQQEAPAAAAAAVAAEGGGSGGGEEGGREESVKLFVGQVPKQMAEAELAAMFRDVAIVDEVTVIRDKATKASRGPDPCAPAREFSSLLPCNATQCLLFLWVGIWARLGGGGRNWVPLLALFVFCGGAPVWFGARLGAMPPRNLSCRLSVRGDSRVLWGP